MDESTAEMGERSIFPRFSLHRPTMRLESEKKCPRSPAPSLRPPITRQAPRGRTGGRVIDPLIIHFRVADAVGIETGAPGGVEQGADLRPGCRQVDVAVLEVCHVLA